MLIEMTDIIICHIIMFIGIFINMYFLLNTGDPVFVFAIIVFCALPFVFEFWDIK